MLKRRCNKYWCTMKIKRLYYDFLGGPMLLAGVKETIYTYKYILEKLRNLFNPLRVVNVSVENFILLALAKGRKSFLIIWSYLVNSRNRRFICELTLSLTLLASKFAYEY